MSSSNLSRTALTGFAASFGALIVLVAMSTVSAKPQERRELDPQIVDAVAERAGIAKDKADAAIKALISHVTARLVKGEQVLLPELGLFAIEKREGLDGRNPTTGAVIRVPGFRAPTFHPAKSLRDAVNK